ncbi:hypothetical protein E2C01_088157 [Portunus trituberculatus]|uniref:Uncharacterized protein n=1 Tax=Portunus trituberculatus TaxID=210409 RepID=A0A5B7J5D7_PORTR|nr:hypothetical protein [Portunus trituberculatus]
MERAGPSGEGKNASKRHYGRNLPLPAASAAPLSYRPCRPLPHSPPPPFPSPTYARALVPLRPPLT